MYAYKERAKNHQFKVERHFSLGMIANIHIQWRPVQNELWLLLIASIYINIASTNYCNENILPSSIVSWQKENPPKHQTIIKPAQATSHVRQI